MGGAEHQLNWSVSSIKLHPSSDLQWLFFHTDLCFVSLNMSRYTQVITTDDSHLTVMFFFVFFKFDTKIN